MPALETPSAKTGLKAPAFSLKGVDGKTYTLDSVKGPKGLLVMFICNHCPYVRSAIKRIVADAKELQAAGIGVVGIMSNDTVNYPDDSFDNMKRFAADNGMTFPYVIDETQEVAKAYDAVCTPDFFGFNTALELQYRGRLDEGGRLEVVNAKRELLLAMQEIAAKGTTTLPQRPSIGCSIKWK